MAKELIIVMGASGSGKSTIGQNIASKLALPFVEGDDFHPATNRAKMQSGIPLTDKDREAWIDALVERINAHDRGTVVACSALTPYVQERLRRGCRKKPTFCCLLLDEETLTSRVAARADHFMPESLVASQLASLDVPADAICVDAGAPPDDVLAAILDMLDKQGNQQDHG